MKTYRFTPCFSQNAIEFNGKLLHEIEWEFTYYAYVGKISIFETEDNLVFVYERFSDNNSYEYYCERVVSLNKGWLKSLKIVEKPFLWFKRNNSKSLVRTLQGKIFGTSPCPSSCCNSAIRFGLNHLRNDEVSKLFVRKIN